MTEQRPSKEKMVEVPISLIKRCFGFVNGYFQMDPGHAESNELWRDLNREITRPRAAQPAGALQPGDKVKWHKGDAVRTVLGEYRAYRVSQHDGVGETLFESHELVLIERAAQPPGDGQ